MTSLTMHRLALALGGAALAAVAIAACGVGATDDLFTTAGTGGTASSSSGSSTSGNPTTSSSGNVTTSSSSSGSVTTSSSSGSTTTSSSSGSATTSSSSSSTSASSSSTSGMPPVTVTCNNSTCNPGEICCFNPNGPGDHCAAPDTCDPGWVVISCNGPEDCPGGECCADVDFNMQVPYLGIACAPSCNQNQLTMCSEQQPNVCPPGTQCKQSGILGSGYHYCGN